jgi:integrase
MQFTEAMELYLTARETDGYAANTVRNDRKYLEAMAYILGDIPMSAFTPTAFDKVMSHERDRGLAAGSLNNLITVGRSFTKWCQARGFMDSGQNPCHRRYIKEPKKVHDYIPIGMFPALLDSAANPRDRILLAMGLYTLARSDEITSRRIQDVDLSTGYIGMTITKTYDSDLIPISSELDRELRRWLTAYADECGPLQPDWMLIPGSQSKGFQTITWTPKRTLGRPEDAVKRALAPLDWSFSSRTGMHLLRRSAARAMFDELVAMGYDGALRRVQTWLHHSSMSQTEQYIGLSLDRQSRDQDTIGQDMFPSLAGVVPLHGARISDAV